uniref:Integrin subunit alpha 6 n=1 Tax=Varanus komodoensis TaxID=61221 RepID=A0A8D2LY71_VARKO
MPPLLYLSLLPGLVLAFNLDTSNVVVWSGDAGSYFGFSLAMHQQLVPEDRRLLLVGAPRQKAFPSQRANRTGGLYSCDIASPAKSCERIQFDEEVDLKTESKEDQWMGVTVQSQGPGGKVVTCAHRYEKRQFTNTEMETRDIFGNCYVLSQDLTINKNDNMDGADWGFCQGRLRGHEKFGSCQQGVAATFTKDYHYIVFGAPGTYNWKGMVRAEQKNFTLMERGIFEDGPYEVGGERTQDESLVPVPANSYLGRLNFWGALLVRVAFKINIFLFCFLSWQDIVVGAPQYFDRDGEIGGAVYVYINQEGKWEGVKPVRLTGPANSMFGIAIENIGDVNQDGFQDIAVGAPYDGDFGKVYIYHGSKDGINMNASQVLTFTSFGYSIAGNMDLDRNTYPDIAVGSLSDLVSVYRARPVINLKKTIEISPERIDLNKKNCQDDIKDKLRPIPVTLAVTMNGAASSSQPRRKQGGALPELAPILNSNEPKTVHSEVQFLKEGCGPDNICNSNLKLHYRFCTKEGSEDKFAYLPVENNVPVLVLKDQKDIALEITVTNSPSDPRQPQKDGEDAHEAKLIASFPDSLTFSAFRELKSFPEKQLTCGANPNGSQVDCELGNPFKRNSNVTFYVILSTTKVNVDTRDLDINLKLETTSNQANLDPITARAKVVIELLLSLTGVAKPPQVYFGGSVIGESAMKSEDDIGSLIEYEFAITNFGKPLKTFGTAFLDILWPKEIKNGKWLLYLVSIHSKELGELQCEPLQEINPQRIGVSNSRTKREVAEKQTEGSKGFSLFSERKSKTLANCVNIRCPLQGLDSRASVTLRSRLWNSTFLEEYSKMNYLEILLRATISIDAAADNIKLANEATYVRVTVFPAKTVALYKGVPWWIILVAVLAGLLMLALLVFLLWKCGFFKRDKKDHYDAAYHKAEIHAQPSDKERLTSDA